MSDDGAEVTEEGPHDDDPEAWCEECGWASETARDLDWEGAKPTCPVCEAWAEVE